MKTFTGMSKASAGGTLWSLPVDNPIKDGSTIRVRRGEAIELQLPHAPQYVLTNWRARSLPKGLRFTSGDAVSSDRKALRMRENGSQPMRIDTSSAKPGDYDVVLEKIATRGTLDTLHFTLRVVS